MRIGAAILFSLCATTLIASAPGDEESHEATVRVATYNVSLYRQGPGDLVRDLTGGNDGQARRIAEVIQRVRPHLILLNEFDYDADGMAAKLFLEEYLAVGQNDCASIVYPEHFIAPVNTGLASGRDLDKDGKHGGPADAIGYGRHHGQYGMLVLSQFAILNDEIRTFQNFLWKALPGALLPIDPRNQEPYYDEEDLAVLRLSSKSVWDVPVRVPIGSACARSYDIHLLGSHPTPPVFDGPEDRNGRRNHDEIRMLADCINPQRSGYLVDDAGGRGGLSADAHFVVVGDLNRDPVDGQGIAGAMDQLLNHSRVNSSFIPRSRGGAQVARRFADQNAHHRGDPAFVTADFTCEGHGNLRVDYVLPSCGLQIVDGGVFWPTAGDPGSKAIRGSDHRLVWLDIRPGVE